MQIGGIRQRQCRRLDMFDLVNDGNNGCRRQMENGSASSLFLGGRFVGS